MIYTNFGTNPAEDYVRVMETKGMRSVDAWTTEDENPIFYYDRHDQSIRQIEFRDFITDEQWEHFKSNEEAIIVINFADDYLNQVDLDRFASDIKFREVDSSRVIFVYVTSSVTVIDESNTRSQIVKVRTTSSPVVSLESPSSS